MFNLLPQKNKKSIKQEYKVRLVSVFLASLIAVEIIFLSTLFPSYVLSVIDHADLSKRLESLKDTGLLENTDEVRGKIEEINKNIELLKPAPSNLFFNVLVSDLLSQSGSGIDLKGINYSQTSPANFEINLSGVASTRESLVAFVDRLESEEIFSSVDLPVSNLAQSNNINFSLYITGNSDE